MPTDPRDIKNLSYWDANDPNWTGYRPEAPGLSSSDIEAQWAPFNAETDPAVQARAFLTNQNLPYRQQHQAEQEAAAKAAVDLVGEQYPRHKPGLRGLTDYYEDISAPVGLASIAPPLRPLGALTAGLLIPGGVRKIIAPQEDESRLGGAGQLGLAALSLLGLKGASTAAPQMAEQAPMATSFHPWGFKPQSKAIEGYGGVGKQLSGLNEQPKSLQALMEEVGQAVPEKVAQQYPASFRPFLSEVAPKVAKRPVSIKRTPKGMLSKMNRESEAGYRNVPSETNTSEAFQSLPKGGLESITPAEWRKLGMRQVEEHFPSRTSVVPGSEPGYGEDLLAELSQRAKRLNIPARARAFRDNTPFTE